LSLYSFIFSKNNWHENCKKNNIYKGLARLGTIFAKKRKFAAPVATLPVSEGIESC
jgi:hypothetical protein